MVRFLKSYRKVWNKLWGFVIRNFFNQNISPNSTYIHKLWIHTHIQTNQFQGQSTTTVLFRTTLTHTITQDELYNWNPIKKHVFCSLFISETNLHVWSLTTRLHSLVFSHDLTIVTECLVINKRNSLHIMFVVSLNVSCVSSCFSPHNVSCFWGGGVA